MSVPHATLRSVKTREGGAILSAPYDAMTIAKWFIAWAEAEDADLSNLKLQKLLYYAQGHHLGKTSEPLFQDQIKAWSHGPVVPKVYHEFKSFGSGDIRLPDDDPFDWPDVDPETTRFLISIWNTYGEYGAWRLRSMTHQEAPWRDHFEAEYTSPTIPIEELRRYFASIQAR